MQLNVFWYTFIPFLFFRYTKTVAGIGITAQKYNPEMKAPIAQDVVVKTMADKLQHIKQVILYISVNMFDNIHNKNNF